MELSFEPREDWPPLTWVARCGPGSAGMRVVHGARVEAGTGWFCEATWDGPFAEAGFDRTDVVFGSGGRVRDGTVVFVSASAPVDRLHVLRRDGEVRVSNSLPGLLAVCGGSVDPAYPGYLYDFRSVTRGVGDYRRRLSTDAGEVELVYHDNVVWDGTDVECRPKPDLAPSFADFGGYRGYLEGRLEALQRNLSAPGREHPFRMLGTISSGYDSPAACALAAPAGLEQAVTFTTARGGEPDSGVGAGRHLGIEVVARSMEAWKEPPGAEVPVLAGAATGGEIYFDGASDLLPGRVVLTGQGGAVWRTGRHHARLTRDLARGDPAGLSLTEYRLWAGFLRVPVPFIGARRADRILEITLSGEMEPWTRGGYEKPIPRRICEEAGIPAGAFGQAKRYGAVSLGTKATMWGAPSMDDYLEWLRARTGAWWRRGRLPPLWTSRAATPVQAGARAAARLLEAMPAGGDAVRRLEKKLRFLGTREYLYKFMFPWALERAKERYGSRGT